MSVGPEAQQVINKKTDWMSILQLVFSLLVFFSFLGAVVLLAAAGNMLSGAPELAGMNQGSLTLLVCAFAALALLNLPSVVSSIGRLAGGGRARLWDATSPKPEMKSSLLNWLPLALFGAVLAGMAFLPESMPRRELLEGVLAALGAVLPAIWLLRVGSGGLWGKHAKRDAGLLSFSIGFTTYFILVLELALILVLCAGLAFAAAASPSLLSKLGELWRLMQSSGVDPEALRASLMEFARSPLVLALIFGMVALALPALEEGFKTLGVWLLSDHKISPAEGYVAGLFSGAGFALVEALLNSAQLAGGSPAEWLTFLLGRFGGTLLHTFNGGLMGWALASSWQDKRRGRTPGVFLLVLLVHALWNGAALANVFLSGQGESGLIGYLPMILLSAVLLVCFLLFTRRVHRSGLGEPENGPTLNVA